MQAFQTARCKGFTLIEIIVVLVILGVVATIALTGYFSWVTKSVGMEALASLKTYKDQVVLCMQMHVGSEFSCNSLRFASSNNFNYSLTGGMIENNSQVWQLRALPRGTQYGLKPWQDYINIRSDSSGNITCFGEGQMVGVC